MRVRVVGDGSAAGGGSLRVAARGVDGQDDRPLREPQADALVTGRVARRRDELDAAVPEQVRSPVELYPRARGAEIDRKVEVGLDLVGISPGAPLARLNHHRDVL